MKAMAKGKRIFLTKAVDVPIRVTLASQAKTHSSVRPSDVTLVDVNQILNVRLWISSQSTADRLTGQIFQNASPLG